MFAAALVLMFPTLPAAGFERNEIEPALATESAVPIALFWNDARQRPRQLRGSFLVDSRDTESGVRTFLRRHAGEFGLDRAGLSLELGAVREGRAGTYVRFTPQLHGLPVFGGEVVVLVGERTDAVEIRAVNLAQKDVDRPVATDARIEAAAAFASVVAALGIAPASVQDEETVLGIDPKAPAALAWRVRFGTHSPRGDWEALVDATSGEIRTLRNRIVHADGTGLVFDPNPVASTGNTALTDSNDQATAALDAARVSVTLPRLDGTGFLRGPYVDARRSNVGNRAQDALLMFNFNRADDHFEEVMVYFHIDRVQNRIQTSLGFDNVNNRVQVAISDGQTADNSFYSPATKQISFGTGGVDDGEDADIIVHEYGHSIQDNQVPGFGGGDEGAMGEGFGDYLAASMMDVLSPEVTSPACVGDWDAVSYSNESPPCLRRVDGTKHYPEFANGQVHADGEIWSAALFRSRTALGADIMDTLVLEAHFLLSNDETFADAANAIVGTDQTLYAGMHVAELRKNFVEQGLSREITPPGAGAVVSSDVVSIDNPRNAGAYANLLDDSKTHTHSGATALRVHFTQITTEVDAACFAGACDNIYLYDAQGRLYQILNGTLGPTDSVIVPGDTVRIRLVTDGSVGRFGYHVDRVDVMGVASDNLFADGFE